MTHAPATGAENRLHSIDRFVCYQKPAPIRTLFYSKPATGVLVTEMMIYHRFCSFLSFSVSKV